MKHAGAEALDILAPLLAELRKLPELVEKRPGVFYRKGQACLHFHEDATGMFADLKHKGSWSRICVSAPEEQFELLGRLSGLDAEMVEGSHNG